MSGFQTMKSAKSRSAVSPVVMKFGGTSVENSEAIQRVAEIVTSRKGHGRVVVVSALAKVTDQLVAMGQKAASGDCDASLGVSKEQVSYQKSLVDLDIAKQRLRLEAMKAQTGPKSKTAPAAMKKQLLSAEQAESYLNSVLKTRGKSGLTQQDVQDLQALLKESGSTSLANSLPGWYGQHAPTWLGGSGQADVESMLNSIKDYKKGLEQTLDSGYPNWRGGNAPASKVDSAGGDEEEIDADIVVNPEDMDKP